MAVIIGSLFLPYTVQFEVGPQEDQYADSDAPKPHRESFLLLQQPQPARGSRSSGTGTRPVNIKLSSILPSLSIANSHQHSPTSSPGVHDPSAANSSSFGQSRAANASTETVENFFLKSHDLAPKPVQEIFTDSLQERLNPHYIQPKSTVNRKFESLVVDLKKKNDEDFGLPSLKVSRSATNLMGMGNALSGTNISALSSTTGPSISSASTTNLSNAGFSRANASLSRAGDLALSRGANMTLHNNSSTSLVDPVAIDPISEADEENETLKPVLNVDSDSNDWDNDFNEMVNPRSKLKLAPFGGFSDPKLEHGVISHTNIFETNPWKVLFAAKGNGSLIKAVKMAVDQDIIRNRKWVGTLAMPTDEVPQHVVDDICKTLKQDYFSEPVIPSDMTFAGHYNSFCKQMLWPTLHYEIPDNPKSKAFEDHSWGHYKALNQMVADKIVQVYKEENGDLDPEDPENMIWIHDYHLLLVPQMIREKLPTAKIGLFLHVSFPSSEVFRCLAQRNALLKGMLGANAISFQTEEYVRHFLQTASRLLLADASDYGISYDGRFTMVNTIPVGIDANSLTGLLDSKDVTEWRSRIRQRWPDQKLIVSRDKLDKLRGIKEKLLAYEKFLITHPSYVDDTVLIQICIGSSSEEDYNSEVMKIVGRINSMAQNIAVSQPVVLLHQDIGFDQYLALQLEADIFVVSSMREGLNLTCHEFIVATTERKSPLMLSEFTGSSQILDCNGQGAIQINPWDVKRFSEMYYKLLTMDPNEKLTRWRNCYEVVTRQDYRNWIKGCLVSINEAWNLNKRRDTMNLQTFNQNAFKKFYNTGDGRRLFFINLETASAISSFNDSTSTKVPVSSKTSDVKNSDILPPSRLANLLNDLLNDEANKVYLCSYLKRSTLDTLFRRLPNLGLIAENGGYIKLVGSQKWISIVNEDEVSNWMPQVKQLVEAKLERLPGSKGDFEDCTVIFSPGSSIYEDRDRSIDLMGDLIQHVNDIFDERDGVHASLIRNSVVVQQNQLSLRALDFLVNFYNQQSVNEFKPREVEDVSTPVKEKHSSPLELKDEHKLLGLFISGGTTLIDEPNFGYGNELVSKGANVLTVAALDGECKGTSAKYGVSGRNELLSIISTSLSKK